MPAAFSENSICPLVIVGSGFASFCLAAHLLRDQPERASDIIIIGPEPFGYGAAYGCSHPDFRLNVRAQIMRIFPDRPTDFRKWAETEIDDIAAHKPQGAFYRRKDFARYLSVLRHQLSGFDKLNLVSDEVVSANKTDNLWQLVLATGQKLTAKALVLATGNSPPRWPCQLASDLPADRLVENPWSGQWLAKITKTDKVAFIGGGLTAMDGIYSLARQGHIGQIEVVLPHGILPPKQTDWQTEPPVIWPDNITTASQFFRFMKQSLRARDWTQTVWQSRFEALRVHINSVWQQLEDTEQNRLMRHVGHWWQLARFRSAPQNFDAAEILRATGRLSLVKGRVRQIKKQDSQLCLILQDGQKYLVDRAVNCTGPAPDRLVQQMLADGLAAPDRTGKSLRVAACLGVMDSAHDPQNNLWAIGAMTASCLGDVIGAGSIAKQAEELAAKLAKIF